MREALAQGYCRVIREGFSAQTPMISPLHIFLNPSHNLQVKDKPTGGGKFPATNGDISDGGATLGTVISQVSSNMVFPSLALSPFPFFAKTYVFEYPRCRNAMPTGAHDNGNDNSKGLNCSI